MQIDSLMRQDESQDYYDPDLRNALEALLVTFRTSAKTTQQPLEPISGVVYRADFFGLLTSMRIQPCFHWFIMRLNNFFSPFEFDETVSSIMIPSFQDLNQVRMIWATHQVIPT